jgi:tripartite-type tricarboxylate transporter receptor subunit TctC
MIALLRTIAVALVALVTSAAAPGRAQDYQDYPVRPVRIIVPFAAGGPADIYGRVVAQYLSESLKQPFIVEDRPGAGSIVGSDVAARAAPDGYTLLIISNTHTANESLFSHKPFELMRDFVPIAPINSSDLVLVVHPSVPANNIRELIALAKAKPGGLNYASSGPGTPYHLAGELFKSMTGTNIVHVPYKGSSGARNDVVAGQVQMMIDAITTMAPLARAGAVRALGTTGLTRSTVLPDVPTISESGVPGYETTIWLGIVAPKGTPEPIVEKLNAEIGKTVRQPDVVKAWAEQGAVPMTMTPAEFGAYLNKDIEKWAHVVKISGAKVE